MGLKSIKVWVGVRDVRLWLVNQLLLGIFVSYGLEYHHVAVVAYDQGLGLDVVSIPHYSE